MTRFAFLFGNTDGLQGVRKDIANIKTFLMSDIGGAWENNEIATAEDISLKQVIEVCGAIKRRYLDYVVVYFSGHGGMKRTTNLCINPQEEVISEAAFSSLAKRQLMILDCCRVYPQVVTNVKKATLDESVESFQQRRNLCRKRYENLIMSASPQEITLYACQPGKCAYDSSRGGFYTHQLLSNAVELLKEGDVYVRTLHEKAKQAVFWDTLTKDDPQDPDIKIVCHGPYQKDFIFAMDV